MEGCWLGICTVSYLQEVNGMIDVNNPEIQKYVEEALQKQRKEIAERILWRNAGAPYLGPSMEEIEY